MYQYIYNHNGLPCSIVINADNKKDADSILKEFGKLSEWTFQERVKN
jgi:hypothetical protein